MNNHNLNSNLNLDAHMNQNVHINPNQYINAPQQMVANPHISANTRMNVNPHINSHPYLSANPHINTNPYLSHHINPHMTTPMTSSLHIPVTTIDNNKTAIDLNVYHTQDLRQNINNEVTNLSINPNQTQTIQVSALTTSTDVSVLTTTSEVSVLAGNPAVHNANNLSTVHASHDLQEESNLETHINGLNEELNNVDNPENLEGEEDEEDEEEIEEEEEDEDEDDEDEEEEENEEQEIVNLDDPDEQSESDTNNSDNKKKDPDYNVNSTPSKTIVRKRKLSPDYKPDFNDRKFVNKTLKPYRIKECYLCTKKTPEDMLTNGHDVKGPSSNVPLSKVLVMVMQTSLQLPSKGWDICIFCIDKLKEADEKLKQFSQIRNDLSTMKTEMHEMLKPKLEFIMISKDEPLRKEPVYSEPKPPPLRKIKERKTPAIDAQKPENTSEYFPLHKSPLTHPVSRKEQLDKIACPLCKKVVLKKSLRKHVHQMHRKETPIICLKCVKKIPSEKEFGAHVLAYHPKDPIEEVAYEVEIDKCISKRKKMKKKRIAPRVICPICKVYVTKRNLRDHINTHEKRYIYKCQFCPEMFVSKSTRLLHHRRVHGVPEPTRRPCVCHYCQKTFIWRESLRRHLKTAHGEGTDLRCEYCGKVFKIKQQFIVHRRLHTNEKPYLCKICSQRFRSSTSCRKHLKRVHKVEIGQLRLNEPAHRDLLPMMKIENYQINNQYIQQQPQQHQQQQHQEILQHPQIHMPVIS